LGFGANAWTAPVVALKENTFRRVTVVPFVTEVKVPPA
jgi:hypothetical protein